MKRPVEGFLTLALGALHSLATVPAVLASFDWVSERGALGGVAREMPPPLEAMPALAALFSSVVGVLLFVVGGLIVRLQAAGLPLPRWLGPTFLLTGLTGGMLLPLSGFWLVALLGLWISIRRP